MKKGILLGFAALLAITMVPGASNASHCPQQLFVFSGQGTTLPDNPAASSDMLNLGAEGCSVPATAGEQPDTRYITPGATTVKLGALNYPAGPGSNNSNRPGTSSVQFDSATPIAVSWVYSIPRKRWESTTTFALPAGTKTITAKAVLKDEEDFVARTVTQVYKALG
jgi:hypothetical protein